MSVFNIKKREREKRMSNIALRGIFNIAGCLTNSSACGRKCESWKCVTAFLPHKCVTGHNNVPYIQSRFFQDFHFEENENLTPFLIRIRWHNNSHTSDFNTYSVAYKESHEMNDSFPVVRKDQDDQCDVTFLEEGSVQHNSLTKFVLDSFTMEKKCCITQRRSRFLVVGIVRRIRSWLESRASNTSILPQNFLKTNNRYKNNLALCALWKRFNRFIS